MSIPAKSTRESSSSSTSSRGDGLPSSSTAVTAESLAMALAAAAVACALGDRIAAAVGFASSGLAWMALVASALGATGAACAQRWLGGRRTAFAGAEALGGVLMGVFFATIGASAGSLEALAGSGWLLAFILLQLGVHLVFTLAVGRRLLRLPLDALLVASNANVGGPATAAAMASAKGWSHLLQPAMITGALGYAMGTGVGLGVAGWLRML